MEIVAINGQVRTELGKTANKQFRKEGKIPCVMYGGGEVTHFTTSFNDIKDLIFTPKFKLAEVEVDGKKEKCIIKEYQMHPATDEVTHIDFLRLVEGTPVKVDLPIKFRGTSPGVKNGGKLIKNVRRIRVKLLPEKIVDTLELDISSLKMGQAIRVRDIDAIEGIEIMTNGSIPVAAVEIPRALRSAAAKSAAAAEE